MSEAGYSEEFSNSPERSPPKQKDQNIASNKASNRKSQDKNSDLISIDTMDPLEQKRKINSPRSIEACRLEGVKPKELLYIPKEKFEDPKLPEEVAELRFEFNENKRKELIALVKKARKDIIKELDKSTYDHPTMAGSTLYQAENNNHLLSQRSVQTSRSTRSKLSMKSSVLVGGAMDKDKVTTQKQMELIKRIREKEQKRFEKYIVNEERKNKIVEEKEVRFEQIRKQEKQRENMIKKSIKEENEKKLKEEIRTERIEQKREKSEKKRAWITFMKNLDEQKKQEVLEEQERKRKEKERILKEQRRLEKVKKCEEAQQKQMKENEKKMKIMNKKYEEQMKKMKQYQIQKKREAEQRALEKRQKIQQIMKAKEEKEKDDLARYLNKQRKDLEREISMKREKQKFMHEIHEQAEQKNSQKDRILKQAEDRMQKRIDVLVAKQKEADERLAKQKEQEKMRELLRQEFIHLNNQSKMFNRQRFNRKTKYKEDKMREKLAMEDIKIETMAEQKAQLKNVRQKALSEMERQRQDIRNALYHMTVWNSFSPKVVQKICDQKSMTGKKPTIEEMVRRNAAKEHLKKSKKHRRTSSALQLRPLGSASSRKKSKNANSQKSIGNDFENGASTYRSAM